jgi:hypothetical protein
MSFKAIVRRVLMAFALTATIAGGAAVVSASPAMAAGTSCKTLQLRGDLGGFAVNPRLDVPICYNGSSVWQNGNITPGVTTLGYYVNGTTWYGTYGGGNWLGRRRELQRQLLGQHGHVVLRAPLGDQRAGQRDQLQPQLLTR